MDTDPSTSAADSPIARPRRSRSLARMIAGRATDLLAIGLVLMVGLSAGDQIVAWWRAEPASMPSPSGVGADELADWDARSVDVTFGESGATLSRRIVSGDRSAAEQALTKFCGEISARVAPSAEPVTADEAEWLRRIERLPTTVESSENVDAVYLLPAPLPQAVSVRQVSSRSVAGSEHRMIATAWALPYGEKRWLLYATPFGGQSAGPVIGEILLPPGARRVLSWRDADGAAVVAFEGSGSLADWTGYYRKETELKPQSVAGNAAVLRGRHNDSQWDVQLQSSGDRVTGICWCTPDHNRQQTPQLAESPTPAPVSRP